MSRVDHDLSRADTQLPELARGRLGARPGVTSAFERRADVDMFDGRRLLLALSGRSALCKIMSAVEGEADHHSSDE